MIFHFFRKNKETPTELNTSNLQTDHKNKSKNRMIKLLPQAILVTLFVGLVFYVKQETAHILFISRATAERQANIVSLLEEMQSQLGGLKAEQEQIRSLQTSLTHLQETVATEQSLARFATSIEVQQLAQRLEEWGRKKKENHLPRASHLSKNSHQKSSAVSVTLPFRIQSLDIIADQSYVSVEYQHSTLPLRVNEALAGWKIIDMNITEAKVIWENLKTHRRITVTASRTLYE